MTTTPRTNRLIHDMNEDKLSWKDSFDCAIDLCEKLELELSAANEANRVMLEALEYVAEHAKHTGVRVRAVAAIRLAEGAKTDANT